MGKLVNKETIFSIRFDIKLIIKLRIIDNSPDINCCCFVTDSIREMNLQVG